MKRDCILVLGAHRSGTSALTRTLSLLGADLPTNLLDPHPYNPTGFWESHDHVSLNDELLASLGLRWDSILGPRWNLLDDASFVHYRDRIVKLLHRDFESSRLFIVKDPRLCRLLPVWRAALERFETEPKCILIVRHPMEVAASLTARDRIPLQTGLLIWLRHLLEAEAGSRDLSRVFVSCELLLNDWRAVALRIGKALKIEWPRTANEAATEIDKFLQPDARHHRIGGLANNDVDGTGPIPAVRKAYEVASAAARGNTADICVAFDELRVFISESESLIRAVIAESHRLTVDNEQLRHDAVEHDQVNKLLRHEIAQREDIIESLRSSITLLRELLLAWEREVVNGKGPIRAVRKAYEVASAAARGNTADICVAFDELRVFISESESLIRAVIADSHRLAVDNEQLRHDAVERDHVNKLLRHEIAQRDDINERLRSSIAQLRELLLAWERELSGKAREIAELGDRLRWREEQVAAQDQELQRIRAAGERRIIQLGDRLAELRGSLSWQLTAPLREIYRFGKRLRRAVWPHVYRFRLQPVQQLKSIDLDRWEAQGPDPGFVLRSTSRSERLPARWCEIEIALDHEDGLQQAILYLDDGTGFTRAINLPRHERGRLRTAVEFPGGIRTLRLAPRQQLGRFKIKEVVIREITRQAAKRLKQSMTATSSIISSGEPSLGSAATPLTNANAAEALNGKTVPALIGLPHEQGSAGNSAAAPSMKEAVRNRLKAEYAAFLASGSELVLPQPRSPLISIVLVLYNQAELTFNCLCSIVAHAGNESEVVIVDNASSDSTVELLKRVRGAIVIRNAENLYFPHGCNQGSEHAQGKYLLLLNNDAQLLLGSLQAATSVLEQNENVGAVGGRILNLTGQLQEAGCILWSDGSTYGYGRGEPSDLPQYMFRRNVDYCSGAFLLTRTPLFRETGGFDEVFSPGYYEEVDYCIQLWKRNWRVVYEPRAVIVHFEYGSSDSAFAAGLTIRHRQIFRNKHSDYLLRREAPDLQNAIRARHARAPRLRVLFIDDCVPHLDQGSGYPRANMIANTMAGIGVAVTVFPMRVVQESWNQVYRDLRPEIEVMADSSADSLAEFLKKRLGDYDAAFVSRPHNMHRLLSVIGQKSSLGRCHLIYDAEAVFALRAREKARIMGDADSNVIAQELTEEMELAAEADDIICVSELERRHFAERGLPQVHILGHALQPKPTATNFETRRDILFVGAMYGAQSPNEDSVLWFCRQVLPIIRRRLSPETIRLIVVGQNTALRLSVLAEESSVQIVGSDEDLSSYYERARIFVAPTRFGAGIPIKILEAAGRAVPIVATSLMAIQLGWTDGQQLLTASAEDPEQFADQCVRLYSNKQLWLHLREEALKRAQEDCSIDSI